MLATLRNSEFNELVHLEASDGTPVAEWTNAFVHAAVESVLFNHDLPDHATVGIRDEGINDTTKEEL